ncbi:putative transporter [Exophiala dermatitidis]
MADGMTVSDDVDVQQQLVQQITPEMDRKMLRKIDSLVLPFMVIISTVQYLDKNGMGYAAVLGLKEDTHLKAQQYSWLGSIFYFGYLLMQLPNYWILTKVPLGRFIGTLAIAWGACICLMGACHNFAGLAVLRFFLGIFEAAIMPTFMIMTALWYKRDEQPLRTAAWYNTFAGIFGGILSYAIGKIDGPLATWKYIFLIYGSVTVVLGIVTVFLLPNVPATAWFFNHEEKAAAPLRTIGNQTGTKSRNKFKISQCFEAVRDLRYWIIVVQVLAWSIVNSGITNFNPLIISGYGFSKSKTVLMATPQAAIAFVAQISCATLAYFIPNIRCLIWTLSCLPALAGAVMIHSLSIETHRTASLAGVYMMGFYNVAWVMMMSLVSSNNAGTTKKTFASVTVAVFYAVGNIIGPQFFRGDQSPHYPLGIGAMMVSFGVEAVCGIAYGTLCVLENRRRDRHYGRPDRTKVDTQGVIADHDDLTDGQNKEFRYVL